VPRDPLAWAWALKAREERDRRSLSQFQRAAWRDALRFELAEAGAEVSP